MRIKNWKFVVKDVNLLDLYNDNIDVSVTLEDDTQYIVVVSTIKNICEQIEKGGKRFLLPGCPQIIVETLEYVNVNDALIDYAQSDAYWLKLHHYSDILSATQLDEIGNEEEN